MNQRKKFTLKNLDCIIQVKVKQSLYQILINSHEFLNKYKMFRKKYSGNVVFSEKHGTFYVLGTKFWNKCKNRISMIIFSLLGFRIVF